MRKNGYQPSEPKGKHKPPTSNGNVAQISEIDRLKYMICCPMCDNTRCVKGTEKCEAEQWAKH